MIQIALLVSQGVPYDVVMEMSAARRTAWIVALGELRGRVFDWNRMEWEPQR